MTPPSPTLRALARRLLAYEAATQSDPPVDAAAGVCRKLCVSLTTFVGLDGFTALATRAIRLASIAAPALRSLSVSADGEVTGLDKLKSDKNNGAIGKERVVLVSYLLGLLVDFIGESLTLNLLHITWPDASLMSPDAKPEEQE